MTLTLDVLPEPLAVARLEPGAAVPAWADGPGVVSITRTAHELSIVCAADRAPGGAAGPFRALTVRGTLDFALTGVVSGLTAPLAQAQISVFVISTFDTDLVLIPAADLVAAAGALRQAGYAVADPGDGR